jgi:hypothetical protein
VAPTRRRGGNSPGVDARRRRRQDTQRTSRPPRRRGGTNGGGSAAAGSRPARGARGPRRGPRRHRRFNRPAGAQRCAWSRPPIHPARHGNVSMTGPAGSPAPLASDRGGDPGFATWAGGSPRPGGRARARPGGGERGRDGVVPRHFRTVSARGRPHGASTPRDRARLEGARADRQAHEGRRTAQGTQRPCAVHRMVRCGKTLKTLPKGGRSRGEADSARLPPLHRGSDARRDPSRWLRRRTLEGIRVAPGGQGLHRPDPTPNRDNTSLRGAFPPRQTTDDKPRPAILIRKTKSKM